MKSTYSDGKRNSVCKTLGASNHTNEERARDDYYATDPIAIDKLLSVEKLHDCIWECACGEGHLSRRLIESGYIVWNTDIVERRWKRLSAIQDFLKAIDNPFNGAYDIVTNPPYKYAVEFVLKSLELLPNHCYCCMFLPLRFFESKTRHVRIFDKYPPIRVHVFIERVLCAPNGDFQRITHKGGSAVAYAWFVWKKGYSGQTIIDWI